MDQQEITVEFLQTELETGITFADLALTAKYSDRRERNRVNARKAYDTALRYVKTLSLAPEITTQLDHRLEHLRGQLRQLGESI